MYATLAKTILAQMLAEDGQNQIDKDANDEGKDDVRGKMEKAVAAVLVSVNLETISKKTLKNTATALRAAADELDAAVVDL